LYETVFVAWGARDRGSIFDRRGVEGDAEGVGVFAGGLGGELDVEAVGFLLEEERAGGA